MMKLHHKLALTAVVLAASTAWSQTPLPAPQWQSAGPLQYVCGGVSDEDMSALKALRSEANGELLFTGGPEGAYLADIAVTIQGGNPKQDASFSSKGPLCLLKLPPGSYTVQAVYKMAPLKQTIKVDGTLHQIKFNWGSY
jgi:hypothetical protein